MARSKTSPNCAECNLKVTSRGKQGLTCASCDKAHHFDCLKISETRKSAILSGKDNYLCPQCKSRHRLSLSQVASTPVAPRQVEKASAAATPEAEPQLTTLLAVIATLQKTVESLEERLTTALAQIDLLKVGSTPPAATKRPPTATNQGGSKDYTLNGVEQEEGEDLSAKVTKVLQSVDNPFVLDSRAALRRLPSKSDSRPATILITVPTESSNSKTLLKAKRRALVGKDVGLNSSEKIYINESLSQSTYKLFRKARELKTKGYKFVWVNNDRVLLRRTEGQKVEHLKNERQLFEIIASIEQLTEGDQQQSIEQHIEKDQQQ